MGGQAVRRSGGRLVRCAGATLGAIALLTASPPDRLTAQVGHSPDHSPYRDVKRGRTLILGAGYLSGGRGVVGVGPSNGSARFEVLFGKPLSFFLGAAFGPLTRYVADPTKNPPNRIFGPVTSNVLIVDGGMHLLLSGAKTWHGMAPYLGGSVAVAIANDPAADTSGYRFRAKGTFGPHVGVRWYLGRRLAIRTEARLMFWQLTYPLAYYQPSPDGTRVLELGSADKEWTRHPWISAGLAWTF